MKKIDTQGIRNTIQNWKTHDTLKVSTKLDIFTDILELCDLVDNQQLVMRVQLHECGKHMQEIYKLEPILSAARKYITYEDGIYFKELKTEVEEYNKSLYSQSDDD